MEQNFATALIFVTVIIALTVMLIALLNFRIKRRMINLGRTDENTVNTLNKLHYDFTLDALKWGLLLLSGGIGLVLLHFIPFETDSTLPYGIEIICLSGGFLAYYFISRRRDAPKT